MKIKTTKKLLEKRAPEMERLARDLKRIKELPTPDKREKRRRMGAALVEVAQCIDTELCRKCPEKAIKQALELLRIARSLSGSPSEWELHTAMARIAARINPELCKSSPGEAAKLALELVITGEAVRAEQAARRITARMSKLLEGALLSFEDGVKLITGEKNRDRALPKFETFMAATFTKTGEAAEWIKRYKSKGFMGNQAARLYNAFVPWWKQEKSNRARKSALANKKRGRVKRPESDLRFTKNRRHKQGYCQKCGKRVRKGERLCDEHLSGNPLLVKPKASVFSDKAGPVDEIDATLSTLAKGTDALPDTYEHLYEHLDGETGA